MYYSLLVHVLECFDSLADVVAGLGLREEFLLSESIEQGTVSLLDEEVETVAFLDVLVHIQNVLMLQEGLDLDLPDKPLDQSFGHLLEGYLFDGDYEIGRGMLGAIDIAKPALSKHFDELEFLSERHLLLEEDSGLPGLEIRRRRNVLIDRGQDIGLQVMKQSIDFIDRCLVLFLNMPSVTLVLSPGLNACLFSLDFGRFDADKVVAIVGAGKVPLASASFQLSRDLSLFVVLELQLPDHIVEV
jgi:hypothetical protein